MNAPDLKKKTPRNVGKTSTSEILGIRNRHGVRSKWAQHYKRLSELREQFLKGRSAQTADAREQLSTSGEHIADAATDSYDRDCALALLSSTQNALYEIDQALSRISGGTYGVCEITGVPIERERLEAIPWTRFSARAQARLESRGAAGRVKLGPLGARFGQTDFDATEEEELEATGEPVPAK